MKKKYRRPPPRRAITVTLGEKTIGVFAVRGLSPEFRRDCAHRLEMVAHDLRKRGRWS